TDSKTIEQIMEQTSVLEIKGSIDDNDQKKDKRKGKKATDKSIQRKAAQVAAEDTITYTTKDGLEKEIAKVKKSMEQAAKDLDFMEAARLRDLMFQLQEQLGKM